MKYLDIKSYKFSTISKFLNRVFEKNFKILGNTASNLLNFINFKNFYLKNLDKLFHIRNYIQAIKKILFLGISPIKSIKYIQPLKSLLAKSLKIFDLGKFIQPIKKISLRNNKFLLLHLPLSVIFFVFLYIAIPSFYNYQKTYIENIICKNSQFKCEINGKINYRFYPTPRIKIKNLAIYDPSKKKNFEILVDNATIKLSIKNLLVKEKHKYTKLDLKKFVINLEINNLKKYKNIFEINNDFSSINLANGKIIFLEAKNYVATIENVNLNLKEIKDSFYAVLKGNFLNDDIFMNLELKKDDNKFLTNIILKLSKMNFLTKANFTNLKDKQDITGGNFLVKKDKNKIIGEFNYQNNKLIIKKSNLDNSFLSGGLIGEITFLPYFNFDVDLNLKSLNFTKFYNIFLSLYEKNETNFFKINNKINGNLNLTTDKMYSNSGLVKALESRIKFYNGNATIEQLLLNFGKLGAADILGSFDRSEKYNNFKFESNIFVDNERKFLSKFGVYNNKKSISPNLFISGNFDLKRIRASFYEISNEAKFSDIDVNFVEKEFNYLMLENGYKDLFNFQKFKKFIKSVESEIK